MNNKKKVELSDELIDRFTKMLAMYITNVTIDPQLYRIPESWYCNISIQTTHFRIEGRLMLESEMYKSILEVNDLDELEMLNIATQTREDVSGDEKFITRELVKYRKTTLEARIDEKIKHRRRILDV